MLGAVDAGLDDPKIPPAVEVLGCAAPAGVMVGSLIIPPVLACLVAGVVVLHSPKNPLVVAGAVFEAPNNPPLLAGAIVEVPNNPPY